MNHVTEKVEGQEVFGGTLKDVRIWKLLGTRSTTELGWGIPKLDDYLLPPRSKGG